MIEVRTYAKDLSDGTKAGDIDEVVAENVSVHLEACAPDLVMLIIESADERVHLNITHNGRSPLRVTRHE